MLKEILKLPASPLAVQAETMVLFNVLLLFKITYKVLHTTIIFSCYLNLR